MKYLYPLALALVLAGCTNKLTPKQKEAISDVKVSPLIESPASYKRPAGGSLALISPRIAHEFDQQYGKGNGLLHAALNKQRYDKDNVYFQANFEELFPPAKQSLSSVTSVLDEALHAEFLANPFFSSRMSPISENTVELRLIEYGFITTELLYTHHEWKHRKHVPPELLTKEKKKKRDERWAIEKAEAEKSAHAKHPMRLHIAASIQMNVGAEELFSKSFYAVSKDTYSLSELVENPENSDALIQETVKQLAAKVNSYLTKLTAE